MAKRITKYSKKNPVVTEYEFDEYAFEGSEPNHQICFCTINSLQMLDSVDKHKASINFSIEDISELLVERLMLDLQVNEMKAADLFYSSVTFTKIMLIYLHLTPRRYENIQIALTYRIF